MLTELQPSPSQSVVDGFHRSCKISSVTEIVVSNKCRYRSSTLPINVGAWTPRTNPGGIMSSYVSCESPNVLSRTTTSNRNSIYISCFHPIQGCMESIRMAKMNTIDLPTHLSVQFASGPEGGRLATTSSPATCHGRICAY